MIRRPPRSTLDRSSAASDVYKRQDDIVHGFGLGADDYITKPFTFREVEARLQAIMRLSLIHISEPTRPY